LGLLAVGSARRGRGAPPTACTAARGISAAPGVAGGVRQALPREHCSVGARSSGLRQPVIGHSMEAASGPEPAPDAAASLRRYAFEPPASGTAASEPLEIAQDPTGLLAGGVGATVWDAGLVLAKYLERPACRPTLVGRVWVELGSGTGIVGLVAASLGARVVLTDRGGVLQLLRRNLARHAGRFAEPPLVLALDWAEAAGASEAVVTAGLRAAGLWPIDGILLGDCTYAEEQLRPLFGAVVALSRGPAGHETEVLLAHEHRKAAVDKKLFEAFDTQLGGVLRRVANADLHPEWQCDEISVWRGTLIAA